MRHSVARPPGARALVCDSCAAHGQLCTVACMTLISRPVMPSSALAKARRTKLTPADVDVAVAALDLTELSPAASEESTRRLVERALAPDVSSGCPPVAAVCVDYTWVPIAHRALPAGSAVRLACVAGAFPGGQGPLEVRLGEVAQALADGADEVDIVVDGSALAVHDFDSVSNYVSSCVELAESAGALVKVILESGELGSPEMVWAAANITLDAGAHFLKTSTGFTSRGATLEDAALLLMAVRDFAEAHGVERGVKVSGGVSAPVDAAAYLTLARELGHGTHPDVFRFGSSGLLSGLVSARRGEAVSVTAGY